jgi:phosphate starvation-inducible protein PhoH
MSVKKTPPRKRKERDVTEEFTEHIKNQNMTKSEITTILTRFGKHSRYFVLGDAAQADIKDSGFISVYESFDTDFSRKNEIQCVEFDTSDIVRSQILKHITQVLRV